MKRILFVDDEPQMLEGLRALLRPQRTRWDMVFVESGEQALDALEQSAFDVIVSDMRMPGMDGATLLRHVQERYPGVVRIVLSGYSETEAALRIVPVAHQFLAKPCDAGALENVVERSCMLQALIGDEAVRQVVGRVQKLPSMPRIYVELTEALSNEDVGVADVARVIERDPTMVAKVLQLVNSAFVGLGREIRNIEQAVSYLGTRLLKDLTLVTHVFQPGAVTPDVEEIRDHSLVVARIAREIAGEDRRGADDAFTAALLHDIGKLVLALDRPEEFARATDRARRERRPRWEIEHEELGVSHAEVGGYLLGLWGLPYPFIEAAANHHTPRRVPPRGEVDVFGAVYVANVLSWEAVKTPDGKREPHQTLDEEYVQALQVHDRLPEWRVLAASVAEALPGDGPNRQAA